ncbi:MAG: phage tail tape measure protein [Bacteroidales bacterium]|nr:phage tail tape measure protein [Bacteroidales bacterium]
MMGMGAMVRLAADPTALVAGMNTASVAFNRSIDNMKSAANNMSTNVSNSFDQMSKKTGASAADFQKVGMAATAAGAVIGLGIGSAVKTTTNFEASMSKVQAISGATGKDLAKLTNLAKELGAKTAFSASQAAEGMQFLSMAGFTVNDTIAAMPGLLDLAAAGAMELGAAADITSNIMSGMGISAEEASRVADVLAKASSTANVDVGMLGDTMKYAAPVAKAFGMSLEEAAALTAKMGDAGIQGSMAGTALRGALVRLAAPPKDAAEALAELGVETANSDGSMRNIMDIVQDLQGAFSKLGEDEKMAAASHIFGQEAMSGWLAVLDVGHEKLRDYTKSLEDAEGTAKKMAETQLNNLKGSLVQLGSAMEGVAISIGGALTPALKTLTDFVTKLVSWFNQLPEPVKTFIAVAGALTSGLLLLAGPILIILGSLPTLAAGFATLVTVLGAVGVALTSPIALAVALGAAFVAVVLLIRKHWEPITEFFTNLWNNIKSVFTNAAQSVVDFMSEWGGLILAVITGPIGLLVYFIVGKWDEIKQFTINAWQAIKDFVVGAFSWMYNHNYYFQAIVDFIKGAWQAIQSFTTAIWKTIKSYLGSIWDNLKSAANTVWNAIKNITEQVWNAIFTFLNNLWIRLHDQVVKAWVLIYSTIKDIWDKIKSGFEDLVKKAWNWGKNLMNEFISGITSKISDLWDTLAGIGESVAGFLGFHSPTELGPGRYADEWAPNLMKMLAQGMEAGIPGLVKAASGAAQAMQPQLAGSSAGGSRSIGSIVVNINGVQDPEAVWDYLERKLALMGVREF